MACCRSAKPLDEGDLRLLSGAAEGGQGEFRRPAVGGATQWRRSLSSVCREPLALLWASLELVMAMLLKRTTPTTAFREGREASRAIAAGSTTEGGGDQGTARVGSAHSWREKAVVGVSGGRLAPGRDMGFPRPEPEPDGGSALEVRRNDGRPFPLLVAAGSMLGETRTSGH